MRGFDKTVSRARRSKKLTAWAMCVAALCSTNARADEWTNAQTITTITVAQNVNPGNGSLIAQYYFYGPSAWGAPSCSSNTIAYTSSSSVGSKEVVASVMLAKSLGKTVKFYGVCQNPGYFVIFMASIDP